MINRLLYAAPLDGYAGNGPRTSAARLEGLRQLNLEICVFDSAKVRSPNPWVRRLDYVVGISEAVRSMNRSLLRSVVEGRPDAVWLDRGEWIYPSTLREIRRTGAQLIYHNTDDALAGLINWNHWRGLRYVDLYVTTNRFNVTELKERYGCNTLRAGMGFDETYHKPVARPINLIPQAVFVGHYEANRERYLSVLLNAGVPLKIWGQNWSRARDCRLRGVTVLNSSAYPDLIASSTVALCFLSRKNRNESTGRTFEIPAIGGLLVADRTEEHDYLYGPGEAEFFDVPDDCVRKVQRCLADPEGSANKAERGQQRLMRLGLSWQAHMRREWPIIGRVLRSGLDVLTPEDDEPFWPGFRRGQPAGAGS